MSKDIPITPPISLDQPPSRSSSTFGKHIVSSIYIIGFSLLFFLCYQMIFCWLANQPVTAKDHFEVHLIHLMYQLITNAPRILVEGSDIATKQASDIRIPQSE